MKHTNILVAGATGYLGTHIIKQLIAQKNQVVAVVRNPKKLAINNENFLEIKTAELTKPSSVRDLCKGIHTVISTVGITRQKDGLTYMDVDYQANINLLNEAKKSGVQYFVYVSAIEGHLHRNLKIFEAKEKFVDALKASGIAYSIIRPNGFFSDMRDFLLMAKKGRVFVFGDGNQKINPIHGEDLAIAIIQAIDTNLQEVVIGGPDILTMNEISTLALNAFNKPIKITRIPNWLRLAILWIVQNFTSVTTYGPLEFFLTYAASDKIAPTVGHHHLKDFYIEEAKKITNR